MSQRTVVLDIGINGAFLTRRWEEPENWMRLTKELGYPYHEFCADVLDPFFSGDREYQLCTARQVREAAEKYGVTITDIYTGMATHRFHGLSHSDSAVRARMREWIVWCMDIARAMGVDRIGGHWDACSVEVLSDSARYQATVQETRAQFRQLAAIAREKGLAAIYNEQMYIPSEVPWTIQQAYEFLEAVNRDNDGVPIYLTVDTGHAAGMHYGAEGEDLDYRVWLRHFGAVSEIVHLQQTTPDASAHWPFTEEYNARGCVRIEEVLAAIEHAHRRWSENPLSAFMRPVEWTILVAEIIPASIKTEAILLAELEETARHLRRYVPQDGLSWTFL
ncbi:MAG: sugar phosphate isomerase/epimerase family protein [Anaerolineae bacterium]